MPYYEASAGVWRTGSNQRQSRREPAIIASEMLHTITQILPLVILIAFGFGLKQAKFLTPEDGGSLLKLVFYAGSPALIFNSIMKAQIDSSLFILCFLPSVIVGITMLSIFLLRRTVLKQVHF